jgi:hypothetical protein
MRMERCRVITATSSGGCSLSQMQSVYGLQWVFAHKGALSNHHLAITCGVGNWPSRGGGANHYVVCII